MLKVCVIGQGHIGRLHARLYKEDPRVTLCAVCDRIGARASSGGEALGVRYYLSAQEMLEKEKPDLCSVATGGVEYSSDHYLPTMQALEFGCHVLCEKPISNDLNDARAMVAKAKEKNRCFALDFNHRFTPVAYAAKKWLDDGLLGDILFCNMALWIGKPGDFDSKYYHLKALNPHSVNMMVHYAGPVKQVHCYAMTAPGRTLYSTASINFLFESGAVGHLTSSYDIERGHPMERCEVAGTKGRFVVEDMWREAALYPAGNMEKRVVTNPVFGGYADFDDTFRARIRAFVGEILAGKPPEEIDGSGEDGLYAQRVIHAAIKSLDTGLPVNVADI